MTTLAQEKVCCDCKILKPVSDYYIRPDTRYINSVCKECMKIRSKRGKTIPALVSTVKSESMVIEQLHKRGIPAVPGKAISFKWVDVVAWGIVRIEVKYSRASSNKGQNQWDFSATQVRRRMAADVTILISDLYGQPDYYILPINSPVFYRDGQRKLGVVYPNLRASLAHQNAIIESGRDNWQLINDVCETLCNQLANGEYSYNAENP